MTEVIPLDIVKSAARWFTEARGQNGFFAIISPRGWGPLVMPCEIFFLWRLHDKNDGHRYDGSNSIARSIDKLKDLW